MSIKILIVDDEADTREMLKIILVDKGYTVLTAEDGQTGLDVAKTDRPDLILTDLAMPRLDGIQMIKRLRLQPEYADLPIVVQTAYHSGIATSEAMDAGANRALRKPVPLNRLLSLIEDLLPSLTVLALSCLVARG